MVSVQHFLNSCERWNWGQWIHYNHFDHVYQIIFNGYIAVTLFFVLTGRGTDNITRVLTLSVLKRGFKIKSFNSLASSILRRPIRLGIPVFTGLLFGKVLSFLGIFNNIESFHKEIIKPTWPLIQAPKDFNGFFDFLGFAVSLFGGLIDPSHYSSPGVIWTIPVEFEGSCVVFLLTGLIICIPRRRWIIFSFIFALLLFKNSWNYLFVAGMWIAELSVTDTFANISRSKYSWALRIILATLCLALLTR